MPREADLPRQGAARGVEFETAFLLPDVRKPIRLLCKRERMSAQDGYLRLGASIIDADDEQYPIFRRYMEQRIVDRAIS
jgi:hypothetical protein